LINIETILVPVDFSSHSERALEMAIGLARTFGAKVHLLHAYHLNISVAAPDGIIVPQTLRDTVRDSAASRLERSAQRVTLEGIQAETHLTADTPSAAIEQTARQIQADLVVMGTRGLTGLKHVFLGSVAERTVRTAPCPVMTVKGEED
jgi:nucleotide-binding universal stress UspA family protein